MVYDLLKLPQLLPSFLTLRLRVCGSITILVVEAPDILHSYSAGPASSAISNYKRTV